MQCSDLMPTSLTVEYYTPSLRTWVCVCVCVCVRERERESVCVCERERECVCVWERESVCVWAWESVCVCVCVREREYEWVWERVRECVCVWVCVYAWVCLCECLSECVCVWECVYAWVCLCVCVCECVISVSFPLFFLCRVCSQRTKRNWSTMPSWRSYLKMWICRGPTLSLRPSSRPSGVWWRPKPASRPSHSCQSTSLHPNTQLVYSAIIPHLHLRGGPAMWLED